MTALLGFDWAGAATACAPTTMYSTLAALNVYNRSLKSLFTIINAGYRSQVQNHRPRLRESFVDTHIERYRAVDGKVVLILQMQISDVPRAF